MGATPVFAWPYPEQSFTPDVPRDIKALAEAVESTVATTPDCCRLSCNQYTTNGNTKNIVWDVVLEDPLAMLQPGGADIKITRDGIWVVSAVIVTDPATGTGGVRAYLCETTTGRLIMRDCRPGTSSPSTGPATTMSMISRFTAGELLHCLTWDNATTGVSFKVTAWMSVVRLGR